MHRLTTCRAAVVTAGLAIATLHSAQAQIEYVQVVIPAGSLSLCRMDFDAIDGGSATVTNVFGTNATNGTLLYFFDVANNRWVTEHKSFLGWHPGTSTLQRGRGFFLRAPQRTTPTNFHFFLMGAVPTAPTTSITLAPGLNLIGYPYPVDMTWTNMQLATNRSTSQIVYFWDSSNLTYIAVNYSFLGWAASPTIRPGEGFWYRATNSITWTEPKPYSFP